MSRVLEPVMFKHVDSSSLMCSADLFVGVLAGLAYKPGIWYMYYPKQVEKCRRGTNFLGI